MATARRGAASKVAACCRGCREGRGNGRAHRVRFVSQHQRFEHQIVRCVQRKHGRREGVRQTFACCMCRCPSGSAGPSRTHPPLSAPADAGAPAPARPCPAPLGPEGESTPVAMLLYKMWSVVVHGRGCGCIESADLCASQRAGARGASQALEIGDAATKRGS